MEFAILVIWIAIQYSIDRNQVTEIGRFISSIQIMFGLLRKLIRDRLCSVIDAITGMYVLGFEDVYVTKMPEGGA